MIHDLYRQDGGIGANGNMVPDIGWFPEFFVSPGRAAGGEGVVNKHYPMGDKAIRAYSHQFTYKCMGLDLAIVPDFNTLLYLYEWPYKTIITNAAFIEINRFYHRHIFPKQNITNAAVFDYRLIYHVILTNQKLLQGA
jgi:hypothetical protein